MALRGRIARGTHGLVGAKSIVGVNNRVDHLRPRELPDPYCSQQRLGAFIP